MESKKILYEVATYGFYAGLVLFGFLLNEHIEFKDASDEVNLWLLEEYYSDEVITSCLYQAGRFSEPCPKFQYKGEIFGSTCAIIGNNTGTIDYTEMWKGE